MSTSGSYFYYLSTYDLKPYIFGILIFKINRSDDLKFSNAIRGSSNESTLNPPSSKVTFNVKLRSGSSSTQYKLEDEIDGNMLSINLE